MMAEEQRVGVKGQMLPGVAGICMFMICHDAGECVCADCMGRYGTGRGKYGDSGAMHITWQWGSLDCSGWRRWG